MSKAVTYAGTHDGATGVGVTSDGEVRVSLIMEEGRRAQIDLEPDDAEEFAAAVSRAAVTARSGWVPDVAGS